ncbi:methylated-DNA--[protein]-cysteine S-methyltransferase [Carboxylicivirga linearis]|uniref:Methylated-DNA--protein-cysteine methyltransferase n=1 Tax=Carboxylicivirga linearis TaxID=1628157 RepID=A0ABS5JSQ3_9BACT|nr:methylated-DNA--[protein]-cysteine S-methyltransferase [Carboxylicivirga linearis]
MLPISIQYYHSPIGELIIGDYMGKLCLCDWRYRKMRDSIDKRIKEGLEADYIEQETDLIKSTVIQLDEYFRKERQSFDLPLELVGSSFQKSVWNALLTIPFGKTETYLGLSRLLGNEKAIRAVASANGANAISIIIPCHRIIGSNGELTGYAGGLSAKKKLLELENALPTNQLQLF